MAQRSVLSQLRTLDQQRRKLLGQAKTEALANAQAAVDDLNNLGFNYRLIESARKSAGGSRKTRKGTRSVKDAPCPICNFKTTPPHDGRAHRNQTRKAPFTAEELVAKGLKKV